MKDLDDKIHAALGAGNSSAELAPEPNLAEEVLVAFRGRHRALTTVMFAVSLIAFAAAVWAGVKFYQADAPVAQLRWAGLVLLLFAVMSMLKIWFWLEMQTNRVLREVKRLELAVLTRRRE